MDIGKHVENKCKTPKRESPKTKSGNNYKTPPSRTSTVMNPFENVLREHLGTNFISPTLFGPSKKQVKNEFSWTIEELSVLKPADIDEENSNQFESPDPNEHCDSLTQSRIDSYFSMQQILPSPMQPNENVPLIKHNYLASPASTATLPTATDSCTQTILSLPPILPEEVEKVLQPYFTFTESQQSIEVHDNASLYKVLFDSPQGGNDEIPHYKPVNCNNSYDGECNGSDIFESPVKMSPKKFTNSTYYQRTIGTPGNFDVINHCLMSPICPPNLHSQNEDDCSNCVANSSQVMSIDGSFTVPDVCIAKLDNSQLDLFHHSSEVLGTSMSAMNWDLEYKQMSSPIPNTNDAMDLSLNTPKQWPVLSQRKKLSDSFNNEDKVDDRYESGYQTNPSSSFDAALHACSMASSTQGQCFTQPISSSSRVETSSEWESVNVVSSTPTKQK